MFKPTAAATMSILLALTACDDGGSPAANVTTITPPKENPFQKRLLALEDGDRNLALRRAIRDDGGQCPRITAATYQEDYKNMAMWVAHCTDQDWAVFVGVGGTVQARACVQTAELGLPQCRAKPKAS